MGFFLSSHVCKSVFWLYTKLNMVYALGVCALLFLLCSVFSEGTQIDSTSPKSIDTGPKKKPEWKVW